MGKMVIKLYEKAEELLAGLCLILGIGIMFIGIVARYVFSHPLTFVDEVAPIFIVWSTFIGYSIALRTDQHIKMDILYTSLKSEKARRVLDAISYGGGILFSFFMMWYGFSSMMMQYKMNRVTQILQIKIWITYLIIPFIGAVLILRYIDLMVRLFRTDLVKGAGEPGEEGQICQK